VTFVRHYLAALLVIAVVVGIGLAWEHSGAASFVGGGGGGGHGHRELISNGPAEPPPASGPSPTKFEQARLGGGQGFSPSNFADLGQTLTIEVAIGTTVIAIDVSRRRRIRVRPRG
jgi:hypothetical protein